jgi:acyl-CoA hydrolase
MTSITLRFLADPTTASFGGKVHGGTIMKWINDAGYACATRWAKGYCMTVFVGGLRFQRPAMLGDLVEVEALLAYTGTTSMNIVVEVRSGDMKTGQLAVITKCLVVFVAVDAEGKPLPIDQWQPETPGDMAVAQRVRAHLEAARALPHGA